MPMAEAELTTRGARRTRKSEQDPPRSPAQVNTPVETSSPKRRADSSKGTTGGATIPSVQCHEGGCVIVPERREPHHAHPSRRFCNGASSPGGHEVASARIDELMTAAHAARRARRLDPQARSCLRLYFRRC